MINIQEEVQKIHGQFGQTELANYKIQLLCDKYAIIQMIKENQSILEMAKEHMDDRAVFVLNDRIANLNLKLL